MPFVQKPLGSHEPSERGSPRTALQQSEREPERRERRLLAVAALAVARLSMLLTQDQLTLGFRMWVVRKFGEGSKMEYLVHCDWCTSMWLAVPIMPSAVLWPNKWVLAAFAIPAASLIAGLLSKARG